MSVTPADLLRARAATLRTFARRVQQLEATSLHMRSGTDTWMGPSPHTCDDSMRAMRTQLFAEVDALMAAARRLERQADALGPR
jgi:hypothetical protein